MKVTVEEFGELKARFEKYLRAVPKELWFAGRKDAPSPARQLRAVQQMFGIDCTEMEGECAPASDARTGSLYSRELRVALSRLEQWEQRQEILERRKSLLKPA